VGEGIVREALELAPRLFKRAPEAVFSVLSKIGPYTTDKFLASLFNKPKSSIKLGELLNSNALVIFRLSKSELGERNVRFIANAIILKLWSEVLYRAASGRPRKPIMLIVDEFQAVARVSEPRTIFSEGRKFGLMPAVAHQFLRQLDKETEEACLSTLRTKVCFALSGEDDVKVASSLDKTRADEVVGALANLPRGRAVCKVEARYRCRRSWSSASRRPRG
jgi:DNA helicase HerA-like ATPase